MSDLEPWQHSTRARAEEIDPLMVLYLLRFQTYQNFRRFHSAESTAGAMRGFIAVIIVTVVSFRTPFQPVIAFAFILYSIAELSLYWRRARLLQHYLLNLEAVMAGQA